MILRCAYQTPAVKPNKKQLTEPRKEQLRKRIEQFATKLTLAGSRASNVQKRVSMAKQVISHNFIDLHDMTGKKANPWTRFLAVQLGENVGNTGKFRQQLFENKRYAEGLLHALENQAVTEAVLPLTKRFKELAKQAGVKSADTGRLMTDLFEVGRTPLDLQLHGKTPAVQQLLQARNAKWVESMKTAGFADADIDELAQLAHKTGAAFDDIHATLEALGKELPRVENVEYLPRVFTREGEDYFKSHVNSSSFRKVAEGADVELSVAKHRNSVWYTAEDHEVLQEVLGVDSDDLTDLISDTAKFKAAVENLDDETVNLLVDSGVMSRVPMTSSEFYQWYSTRYDLPFKTYDELLVTDPRKILHGYTKELELAAGNLGMAKGIADQGVAKGFVVDEATAREAGLSSFIPVSKMKSADILTASGVSPSSFIHKDVAAVVDAAMHIERSPGALSAVAQSWKTAMNLIKNQMLSTPQYVSRIFISDTFMYAAHGGEMHEVITSLHDLTKYMTQGLKAFDNTRPFRVIDGRTVTHREFVELFATRRMGSLGTGFSSGAKGGGSWAALNPLNAPKKVSLMHRMIASQDSFSAMAGQLWREAGYVYSDWVKAIYQPFAFSANFLETAFKLGLFKSVTKRGDAWDAVRGSLRYVSTMEGAMYDRADDALLHVDRAFLTMDDMGEIPGAMNSFVVPFFSYTWKSSSAIVRDAVRNPLKYMQYARIASMVYDRIEEQEGEGFMQAELAPYINSAIPFNVYSDDDGNTVFTTLTNVHPLVGFVESTASNIDKFARLMGIPMGTSAEVRDMLLHKYGIKTKDGTTSELAAAIGDALEKTYLTSTGFSDIAAKSVDSVKKPWLEDKYNTFLGIEMSPLMEKLVGSVFPLLRTVNMYNPGGVFGQSERRTAETIGVDESGNVQYSEGKVLRDGQEGITGVPRTDMDNKDLVNRVTQNPLIALGQLAGLSFSYQDTGKNLKYTHKDITKAQEEVEQALKQALKGERHASDVDGLVNLWGVLEYDRKRLEYHMRERGLTSVEFDKKVRDAKVSLLGIKELPYAEQQKVLDKMRQLRSGG